jgi:hypothetical protein
LAWAAATAASLSASAAGLLSVAGGGRGDGPLRGGIGPRALVCFRGALLGGSANGFHLGFGRSSCRLPRGAGGRHRRRDPPRRAAGQHQPARLGARSAQRSAEAAQAQAAPAPADEPAAPEAAVPQAISSEQIELLKQLAGLKDQGILTEEEFSAKKAQILGL